jgi:hypothetical protein
MGCTSVKSLKEKKMHCNIYVTIVDLAEIFSTNNDREMFLIQGEVRRGGTDTSRKRSPISCTYVESKEKEKGGWHMPSYMKQILELSIVFHLGDPFFEDMVSL